MTPAPVQAALAETRLVARVIVALGGLAAAADLAIRLGWTLTRTNRRLMSGLHGRGSAAPAVFSCNREQTPSRWGLTNYGAELAKGEE